MKCNNEIVCVNIDDVFELFEVVVLANFHNKYSQKSKKKLLYFCYFFVFEEKTMAWHHVYYDPLYHIF